MRARSAHFRPHVVWRLLAAVTLLFGALLAFPASSSAAASLPCDIYGAAGTPCVSADSTVRALYAGYKVRSTR